MAVQSYEELILHGIKGLPDETLAEIVDFIYFARQKALHPQVFAEERRRALLEQELKQLSRDEEAHLEQEFADYEQRYPRE